MRQTFRLNTFETNSSSMHSMVIIPDKQWEDWCNNKLFYLDYKPQELKTVLAEDEEFATLEILEKYTDIPRKADFDNERDYQYELRKWCDKNSIYCSETWYSDYEQSTSTYISESGDVIHICCAFGYNG